MAMAAGEASVEAAGEAAAAGGTTAAVAAADAPEAAAGATGPKLHCGAVETDEQPTVRNAIAADAASKRYVRFIMFPSSEPGALPGTRSPALLCRPVGLLRLHINYH